MKKPTLIIIAGPNGSGKTSVTGLLLNHEWIEGCVYINPDNIARDRFGDWNSPEAVMQAAVFATELREKSLEEGKSIIFETVFSAPDKVFFIQKAKAAGYFIRFFFVGTDSPTINASRVAHRVMEGGHDVPISKIVNRYYKSIGNCSAIANLVDRLYIYDNSVDYAAPKPLFRVNNGVLAKVYNEVNDWATEILAVCQV
jgi:predicted ABC-type ATPase